MRKSTLRPSQCARHSTRIRAFETGCRPQIPSICIHNVHGPSRNSWSRSTINTVSERLVESFVGGARARTTHNVDGRQALNIPHTLHTQRSTRSRIGSKSLFPLQASAWVTLYLRPCFIEAGSVYYRRRRVRRERTSRTALARSPETAHIAQSTLSKVPEGSLFRVPSV